MNWIYILKPFDKSRKATSCLQLPIPYRIEWIILSSVIFVEVNKTRQTFLQMISMPISGKSWTFSNRFGLTKLLNFLLQAKCKLIKTWK